MISRKSRPSPLTAALLVLIALCGANAYSPKNALKALKTDSPVGDSCSGLIHAHLYRRLNISFANHQRLLWWYLQVFLEQFRNDANKAILKLQATGTGAFILPLASPLDEPKELYVPPWTIGKVKWNPEQGAPVDAGPVGAAPSAAGPDTQGGAAASPTADSSATTGAPASP